MKEYTRTFFLFLELLCFDKTFSVRAPRANYYSENNSFNRETYSVDQISRNFLYNSTHPYYSQSTTEYFNRFNQRPDWYSGRNMHVNPIESFQKDGITNKEENSNNSVSRNGKQTDYIGLSLIKNVDYNKTTILTPDAQKTTVSLDLDLFYTTEHVLSVKQFTKEELECFEKNYVYHNHSCHELFKRNSCGEGELLVLDLKAILKTEPEIIPKCTRNICKNDEIFWYETQECYKSNDRTNQELCLPGNALERDYFSGYGTCRCIRQPVVHGLFKNGLCFPLFTQGPCPNNYIFIENDDVTNCVRNPCENASLIYYEDGDKNCYELDSIGPCDKNKKFRVSTATLKPTCSEDLLQLSVINPPELCVTNSDRVCQPEFKVNQGSAYIKKILIAAHKKRVKSTKSKR